MQHRSSGQSTVLHFGLFLLEFKKDIKGKIRPSNYITRQHLDKASGAQVYIKLRKSLFTPIRYQPGKKGNRVAQYLALQGFVRWGSHIEREGEWGSITEKKGLGMKSTTGS